MRSMYAAETEAESPSVKVKNEVESQSERGLSDEVRDDSAESSKHVGER